RLVGVVALQAVANRRRMNRLSGMNFLLIVAAKAQRLGSGGRQLYAGNVFVDPNLVAGGATGLDCRMDVRALGLVLMTFQTSLRIGFRIERHRMFCRRGRADEDRNSRKTRDCTAQLHYTLPY